MEYLFIDPNILQNKLPDSGVGRYNFIFLNIVNDYIPTQFYNQYLNDISEYKLKNIWNHIVIKWICMHNALSKTNRKEYLSSEYSNQKYNHIHELIDKNELDKLIEDFINGDIFKALFAVNCIQNHFIEI
jgi:hypothetical protein